MAQIVKEGQVYKAFVGLEETDRIEFLKPNGVTYIYKFKLFTDVIDEKKFIIEYQIIRSIPDEEIPSMKGEIVFADLETYTKFYTLTSTDPLGDSVHKACLNAIASKEIGDEAVFFNPRKNFIPIQPIFYNVNTTSKGLTVDLIDVPVDASLVYSVDGFKTYAPLVEGEEIDLDTGLYTLGVMNVADSMPFFKVVTITEEV